MDGITQLKQAVAAALRDAGGIAGAKVLTAYPAVQREFPLRGPVVAVGVEQVALAPGGFGGYFGAEAGGAPLYGSGATVTLRFDLYCPAGAGAEGCEQLFEALCDRLVLQQAPLRLQALEAGAIAFNTASGANHMAARGQLHAALTLRDDSAAIERFAIVTTRMEEREEKI